MTGRERGDAAVARGCPREVAAPRLLQAASARSSMGFVIGAFAMCDVLAVGIPDH
jgi:hypothetical protein